MAYLAMRALLLAGRGDEAQAELLAVVSAADAPLELCLAAVKVTTHRMHVPSPTAPFTQI